MMKSPFVTVGACFVLAGVCAAGDTRPAASAKPAGETTSAMGDFPLTPKNGPWMVMVKSFKGPDAIKIANQLARELRDEYKIPAYTFVRRADEWRAETGGVSEGHVRQADSAAVLAGDCPDEKAADKLQNKIHAIRPKAITAEMVPKYQWQAGPLRTALCLPNPLAAAPSAKSKPDPLILKLNAGKQSVFNCPGDYSLAALSFSGGVAFTDRQAEELKKSSLLEAAGEHAEQVAAKLRKNGIDAYTFHSRTASMVLVGAFGSAQDPQIEPMRRKITNLRIDSWTIPPEAPLVPVPKK